jgi:hypothetical protein
MVAAVRDVTGAAGVAWPDLPLPNSTPTGELLSFLLEYTGHKFLPGSLAGAR